MGVLGSFAIAGIILILGFIGNYFYKKVSIPDILILIFLGYLIGPALGLVDANNITPILPLFSALALVVILFDGGLNLNLNKVLTESPRAVVLAVLGFFFSVVVTVLFTRYFFGWGILTGALLGSIIGGTSSSVVIPLVRRATVSDRVKTLLSLESAFTDALVVVGSLAVLQLIMVSNGPGVYTAAAKGVASAFSIGAVIGVIVGLIWLKVLRVIKDETYDDILTLAFVLFMYAVVEALGGNGAIFALIFGLVLGNGYIVARIFRIKQFFSADAVMKKFQSEISFLLRTFFFVYVGLIFSIRDAQLIAYTALLGAVLVVARYAATYVSTIGSPVLMESRDLIGAMLSRGLAAAVLAQIVVAAGIPEAQTFANIIIIMIIITTIAAAVGTSFFQHQVESKFGRE